jgi:NTP pyrophosphatase (non-canonical NTP hydrolase)
MNIDLNKYTDFVAAVTSQPSNDHTTFINRCDQLNDSILPSVNVPLLLTACLGLSAESGEFIEIWKKVIFQGKPLNEENVFHAKRELGDIFWYWINACRALNLDPDDVIIENIKKLESRYPGGHFDVFWSENRKEGDL